MQKRFPSVARLERELNVSHEAAMRIRGLMDGSIDPETSPAVEHWIWQCYNKPTHHEMVMTAINEAMDAYGVEAIEAADGSWIDNCHLNIKACYCNTGDTYAATILLCHKTGRYMLTTVGDYVARGGCK